HNFSSLALKEGSTFFAALSARDPSNVGGRTLGFSPGASPTSLLAGAGIVVWISAGGSRARSSRRQRANILPLSRVMETTAHFRLLAKYGASVLTLPRRSRINVLISSSSEASLRVPLIPLGGWFVGERRSRFSRLTPSASQISRPGRHFSVPC